MSNFPSPSSAGPYVAPPLTPYVAAATPKTEGLAVAGMVCGIVGLLLFVLGVLPMLAVIFSGVALNRITKSNGCRKGKGLAITGLVTGIAGCAVGLLNSLAVMA